MQLWTRSAAVCLFALGVFVCVSASSLRYYTPLGPGPGFLPFWLGLGLAVMSVVLFVKAWSGAVSREQADSAVAPGGWQRLGAMTLALVLSAVMFLPLGYRITTLLFLVFAFWYLGRPLGVRGWSLCISVAAVGSFGVFVGFQWLNVPLPVGSLGL